MARPDTLDRPVEWLTDEDAKAELGRCQLEHLDPRADHHYRVGKHVTGGRARRSAARG